MNGFVKTLVILMLAFGLCLVSFETVSAQTAKKKKARKTTVAKKKTVKKKTVTSPTVASPELPYGGLSSGQGSGRGVGRGNGSGDGSGTNTIPPPPPIPQVKCADESVSTAVRVTSKPRVAYTEEARQNRVQGVVRLRVTFNANGTIGVITPVSGLNFGLTEKAIEAARLMKFEPFKKCGVPYSVTKEVPYIFNLL